MKKISTLAKVYIAMMIAAVILIIAVFIKEGLATGFGMFIATSAIFGVALENEFGFKSLVNGTWLYEKKRGGR